MLLECPKRDSLNVKDKRRRTASGLAVKKRGDRNWDGAEGQIERANGELQERILQHPWWRGQRSPDGTNKIIEFATAHMDGAVLVDSRGSCTWAPPGMWYTGRHLRIEIPRGGYSRTSAAFALLCALDEAVRPVTPLEDRVEISGDCEVQ